MTKVVSIQQEFWFTAIATFLYFTAFIAELSEFADMEPGDGFTQAWIDAQVAAGVMMTNLVTVSESSFMMLFVSVVCPIQQHRVCGWSLLPLPGLEEPPFGCKHPHASHLSLE